MTFQKPSSFGLFYCVNAQINRLLNVPLHLRQMTRCVEHHGHAVNSYIVESPEHFARCLQHDTFALVYILAHSTRPGIWCGSSVMSAQDLPDFMGQNVPEELFLNTCDGLGNGWVEAALSAGINSVIAASTSVPIFEMASFAEHVFRHKFEAIADWQTAISESMASYRVSAYQFHVFR